MCVSRKQTDYCECKKIQESNNNCNSIKNCINKIRERDITTKINNKNCNALAFNKDDDGDGDDDDDAGQEGEEDEKEEIEIEIKRVIESYDVASWALPVTKRTSLSATATHHRLPPSLLQPPQSAVTILRSRRTRTRRWNILIIPIILFWLLCHSSHVQAIQNGRLMTPSSFVALSGDLHVQIQFNPTTVTASTTTTSTTVRPTTIRQRTTTTTTTTKTDVVHEDQTDGRLNVGSNNYSKKQQDDNDILGRAATSDDTFTISKKNATARTQNAIRSNDKNNNSKDNRKQNEIHNANNADAIGNDLNVKEGNNGATTATDSDEATSIPSTQTQTQIETQGSTTQTAEEHIENVIISTLVISKYINERSGAMGYGSNTDTNKAQKNQIKNKCKLRNPNENCNIEDIEGHADDNHANGSIRKEIICSIPIYPDPRHNVTQIAVPCQTFTRGGLYEMQVVSNLKTTRAVKAKEMKDNSSTRRSEQKSTWSTTTITAVTSSKEVTPHSGLWMETTTTLVPVSDERLRQTLDVRWPKVELKVSPQRLRTYPERSVNVELQFPEVNCENAWRNVDLPEFWLELVYCGRERPCMPMPSQNITNKSNVLFAEQIRGFPKRKTLKLGCELFGLAGNYAVQLRPMVWTPGAPAIMRSVSVDWSDKFVFNVYARSIFPCDPHTGIGVLYEYPSCILEQGDRVRVFAKLRADVASLKPPTSLHYVAEQRVVKGQYSLYFNCELFTEKYVEYCFVYVSQAISGAVADVRMDCVPTLPVSDSDTGGWGPWSEWTTCSTNCLGGTRNRYRFCDSPPPRYGAKFCEGPSVETEKCGASNITNTWDCIYENSRNALNKFNRTDMNQEIGPGCRCGCIVHLGAAKPTRFIAGSTQSCPGRSFWLIQVDGQETISLSFQFLRLPCATQYIKIRDGPSLSSTLLIEFNGGAALVLDKGNDIPLQDTGIRATETESSGAQLLMEFYAGNDAVNDEMELKSTMSAHNIHTNGTRNNSSNVNLACTGGFLASVKLIGKNASAVSTNKLAAIRYAAPSVLKTRIMAAKTNRMRNGFTAVHIIAFIFASIVIAISLLLGSQYFVRYRKYHLAIARQRDESSCLHTPRTSMNSLQMPPSRAISTTTLLSEVIFLVRMRPKHQLRHSILRESVDAENLDLARETEFNGNVPSIGNPSCGTAGDDNLSIHLSKRDDDAQSHASNVTLRNELYGKNFETNSLKNHNEPSLSRKLVLNAEVNSLSGSLARKEDAHDSESIVSSGMSSFCNSPPMNAKRFNKYSGYYDAITLEKRNSLRNEIHSSPPNDSNATRSSLPYLSARSASGTLTNGCYSPAASVISTATIRLTNPKESKDKQNRRKLLARPGSEFSLGNQEDLELDYYDYNVTNAGAAPGSYLGMDPAYLIWIPPFDDAIEQANEEDGDKTPEPNESEIKPLYERIEMSKYGHYLTPGSNSESTTNDSNGNTNVTTPASEEVSPLNSNVQSNVTTPSDKYLKSHSVFNQQACLTNSSQMKLSLISKPTTSAGNARRGQRHNMHVAKHESSTSISASSASLSNEVTPLHDYKAIAKPNELQTNAISKSTSVTLSPPVTLSLDNETMVGSYTEKETEVLKSPVDNLQMILALHDIQYADESETDLYDASDAMIKKDKDCCRENAYEMKNVKKIQHHSDSADAECLLRQKSLLPNDLNYGNVIEAESGEVAEGKGTSIKTPTAAAIHTTENKIHEIND